jgi:hypothetical protein
MLSDETDKCTGVALDDLYVIHYIPAVHRPVRSLLRCQSIDAKPSLLPIYLLNWLLEEWAFLGRRNWCALIYPPS